jgi:three-Cys-motif partner protein
MAGSGINTPALSISSSTQQLNRLVRMDDIYSEREQTSTKHFLLKSYLQTLVYKLFHGGHKSITYVDGFSGPWKSRTENFSDSSFMIAINVLRAAHYEMLSKQASRTTKCFLVEKNPKSYALLRAAVKQYHSPDKGFYIETFEGEFEAATSRIVEYIGQSFALVFIDPTGWTGYTYDSISPILKHAPGEVLINFMYDFVNRAAAMDDPKTIASLDPIFGGPGWKSRLRHDVPLGQEIERTFRNVLKQAGGYKYVLSTRIDKSTADRPHFCIAYGTRAPAGLKAFRQVEASALKGHSRLRLKAKQTKRQTRTGQNELFSADLIPETSFEQLVEENTQAAKKWILELLKERKKSIQFGVLLLMVLEQFVLRETNVKDVCVQLAADGLIDNTWKPVSKNKPYEGSPIMLSCLDVPTDN